MLPALFKLQIPFHLGGLQADAQPQALFIDCHGDFSVERMTEMAKHLRSQVLRQIDKDPNLLKKYRDDFSVERILSKVHYVRLLDEAELQLLSQMLERVC